MKYLLALSILLGTYGWYRNCSICDLNDGEFSFYEHIILIFVLIFFISIVFLKTAFGVEIMPPDTGKEQIIYLSTQTQTYVINLTTIAVPYKIEGWHCVEWFKKTPQYTRRSWYLDLSSHSSMGECTKIEGYRNDGIVVWRDPRKK